jgi:hypothetical protein
MKYLLFLLLFCDYTLADNQLDKVVKSWATLGMRLPSQNDVSKFSENIPASLNALKKGLEDKDKHIRKSTAYVIQNIGKPALGVAPTLIESFKKEKNTINKIYYINALISTDYKEVKFSKNLKDWYQKENEGQLKSSLASALLIVNKSKKDSSEYKWAVEILTPNDVRLEKNSDAYYSRWEGALAVSALLNYFTANQEKFINLAEGLSAHDGTPNWVKGHLKRHIQEAGKN